MEQGLIENYEKIILYLIRPFWYSWIYWFSVLYVMTILKYIAMLKSTKFILELTYHQVQLTGYCTQCKLGFPSNSQVFLIKALKKRHVRLSPSSAVAVNWWTSNISQMRCAPECHQFFLIYLKRWNNQSANSSVPLLLLLQYFIRDASLSRVILQLFCSLKIQVKTRKFTMQGSSVFLVKNHRLK